jgi:hypothetical protein
MRNSSDMTTKRLKEPFNPALDAPIALTPDQIEQVAGGMASVIKLSGGGLGSGLGGATTGIIAPPPPLSINLQSLTAKSS